jgi:hypothetical protein
MSRAGYRERPIQAVNAAGTGRVLQRLARETQDSALYCVPSYINLRNCCSMQTRMQMQSAPRSGNDTKQTSSLIAEEWQVPTDMDTATGSELLTASSGDKGSPVSDENCLLLQDSNAIGCNLSPYTAVTRHRIYLDSPISQTNVHALATLHQGRFLPDLFPFILPLHIMAKPQRLCLLLQASSFFDPENGSDMFPRNVG